MLTPRIRQLVVLACVTVCSLALRCTGGDDHGYGGAPEHQCERDLDMNWQDAGIYLIHEDPRECPVFVTGSGLLSATHHFNAPHNRVASPISNQVYDAFTGDPLTTLREYDWFFINSYTLAVEIARYWNVGNAGTTIPGTDRVWYNTLLPPIVGGDAVANIYLNYEFTSGGE